MYDEQVKQNMQTKIFIAKLDKKTSLWRM